MAVPAPSFAAYTMSAPCPRPKRKPAAVSKISVAGKHTIIAAACTVANATGSVANALAAVSAASGSKIAGAPRWASTRFFLGSAGLVLRPTPLLSPLRTDHGRAPVRCRQVILKPRHRSVQTMRVKKTGFQRIPTPVVVDSLPWCVSNFDAATRTGRWKGGRTGGRTDRCRSPRSTPQQALITPTRERRQQVGRVNSNPFYHPERGRLSGGRPQQSR